jgi:hypothetical protein
MLSAESAAQSFPRMAMSMTAWPLAGYRYSDQMTVRQVSPKAEVMQVDLIIEGGIHGYGMNSAFLYHLYRSL